MRESDSATGVLEPDELLQFEANDVTGTKQIDVSDVAPSVPAGTIAKAIAARMMLPANTPYALHDSRGTMLDEGRPIAQQIQTGESVTLIPKTHLG